MFNTRSAPGRASSGTILCLALALAAVPAGVARAAELCADLEILIGRAHSNFSDSTTGTMDAAIPLMLPGAGTCAVTRSLSGRRAYHCVWTFAYRAAGAYDTFDAFNRSFDECFGDRARVTRDRPVNHPDTYDLRQYRLDRIGLTVSIKDKGALQATYVFVRVFGADPG